MGKPEVAEHQIWAIGGLSQLGDLMFLKKTLFRDMMHERACCRDEAANHQLPISGAVFIILHLSTDGEH